MVRVDTLAAHRIASFRPQRAIGSTVDKEPAGSIPALALESEGLVQRRRCGLLDEQRLNRVSPDRRFVRVPAAAPRQYDGSGQ